MEYPIIIRATDEVNFEMINNQLTSNANTGESEYSLFEHLKNKNLPVYKNQLINHFTPDILVYDKKIKLLIDIEIDEPYSKSGIPRHYIGFSSDQEKNLFFEKNGIHIIRFSERQVVSNLNICYLIVDLFIKSMKEPKYETTLKHWCRRISEPRWTKEYSKLLLQNKARDVYPFNIIFENDSINIIKIGKPINFFTDPVLSELSTDDTIEIPTLVNRIKNLSTGELGFSYYGIPFTNSEYNGRSQEITKVRFVLKDNFEYPYFEKYFFERIIFNDHDSECVPFMIVKTGQNHNSNYVILIK